MANISSTAYMMQINAQPTESDDELEAKDVRSTPSCSQHCLFASAKFLSNLDREGLNQGNNENFSTAYLSQNPQLKLRQPSHSYSPSPPENERKQLAAQVYTQLPSNSTRLLCVKPGSFYDVIDCELMNYHVQSFTASYTALSYSWGKPVFTARIMCNGVEFPVTQSLFNALCFLRQERDDLLIWVDAVCINQVDLAEKSCQIPLMYQIYAQAAHTIIWLGLANEKDAVMLEQLKGVSEAPETSLEGYHRSDCVDVAVQMHAWLARFLQRRWFTRSWIRQEVAASKDCTMICGASGIHFTQFEMGVKRFLDLRLVLPRNTVSLPVQSGQAAVRFYRLLQQREDFRQLLGRAYTTAREQCPTAEVEQYLPAYVCREWFRLVLQGTIFSATDPRDKIFSIGSPFEHAVQSTGVRIGNWSKSMQLQRIHADFQMSYTLSVSEIYLDFIKTLVNVSRTLEPLSFFRPSYPFRPDLYTWGIDLRKPEGGCLAAGSVAGVGFAEKQKMTHESCFLDVRGTTLGKIRRSLDNDQRVSNLVRVQLDDVRPLELFQNERPQPPQLDRLWADGMPLDHILGGMGYGMFEVEVNEHARTKLGLSSDFVIIQAIVDAQEGDIVICAYGGFHPYLIRIGPGFITDDGLEVQQFCGPSVVWMQLQHVKFSEQAPTGSTDRVASEIGFQRWRPSARTMNERLLGNEQVFHLF